MLLILYSWVQFYSILSSLKWYPTTLTYWFMLLQDTSELFNRYKEGNSFPPLLWYHNTHVSQRMLHVLFLEGIRRVLACRVKEGLHEASIIDIMLESKRVICSCIPLAQATYSQACMHSPKTVIISYLCKRYHLIPNSEAVLMNSFFISTCLLWSGITTYYGMTL